MLPRELPISEEAIDQVEATMFALEDVAERTGVAEAVIRAFLQAEGFEVQFGRLGKSNIVYPVTSPVLADHSRVRGRWQPLAAPSSTEGGEGS